MKRSVFFAITSVFIGGILAAAPDSAQAKKKSAQITDVETVVLKKALDPKPIKMIKGADKVGIAGFRVIFSVSAAASAHAGDVLGNVAGQKSSGASAKLKVLLAGIDPQDLQAITEQAYADFIEQLKAAGVTPVPTEEVTAHEAFKELDVTPSSVDKPYTKNTMNKDLMVFTPKALPLWFGHFDAPGNIGDKLPLSLGNWKKMNAVSRETKMALIVPQIFVDFVDMDSSGNSRWASEARVECDPGIKVRDVTTSVQVFYSKTKISGELGNTRLEAEIPAEGKFGELRELSESDNQGLVSSFMNLGLSIGPVRSKKTVVLQADKALYSNLALQSIKKANRLFSRSIAEARQ